jgi:transcriptional regulator with XRE-family HTH domain
MHNSAVLRVPNGFYARPAIAAALAAADLGPVFRAVRAELGLTQEQLGLVTGLAQSQISKVERGNQRIRSVEVIARVANALDIPAGLLGFPGASSAPALVSPGPLMRAPEPGNGQKAVLMAAVRLLVDPVSSPPPAGRIGKSDVERLRQHFELFRLVDERIGGGELRHVVTAYLDHSRGLLSGRISDGNTRAELHRLLGDLHIMAAWMHLDADETAAARAEFDLAQRLARAGREPVLVAHGLLSRGQALHDRQRYEAALHAMGQARAVVDRGPPAGATMVISAHEAIVHAEMGNREATLTALGRAQDAFVASERDDPQWAHLRDEMWLMLAEGRCQARLAHVGCGDADRGVALVRRAVAMNTGGPGRTAATMFRELAVAELAVDGIDDAKRAFRRGMEAATSLDSARAVRRLRVDFRKYAMPHAIHDEEIRDIGRHLGAF